MPKKMTTEGPVPMSAPEQFRKSRGFTSIGDRYNPLPGTSSSKPRDLSHTAGTYVDWAPVRSFPTPVKTPQKPKLHVPTADDDGSRPSSLSDAAAFASPAASAYSESFQDCNSEGETTYFQILNSFWGVLAICATTRILFLYQPTCCKRHVSPSTYIYHTQIVIHVSVEFHRELTLKL
jgi:hypothetical protein